MGWIPPAIFAAIAVVTIAGYAVWPGMAAFCPAEESAKLSICAREWIGALSGWAAAIAAGITVAVIYGQTRQAREFRDDDARRKAVAVADVITLDLLETSARIRRVKGPEDLAPPLSETSHRMIAEAVEVRPMLAAMLQRHCREIDNFEKNVRTAPAWVGARGVFAPDNLNKLAYRTAVLAKCFNNVSTALSVADVVDWPPISPEEIADLQAKYRVTEKDSGFLDIILKRSG